MDSIIFMLESGLLVLLPFTALTVVHYARKLHHLWREFRMTQFIWQNQYHILLFEFETNVFVFATFGYALAKSHEFVGRALDEAERIVKGVMGMADKLDPKEYGKKVPDTMAEIKEYL
ncbi:hypothetical protein TWF788_004029 [Orbilia oligospora]|uniref:Uncharacterized protein n=1 Tax=Orbilia oligospora TaxID=2813651 RepID=A0A7C8KB48_ORBOL|nr:hypothetical protein TWF788_004029 [Orbilia oligospora]